MEKQNEKNKPKTKDIKDIKDKKVKIIDPDKVIKTVIQEPVAPYKHFN